MFAYLKNRLYFELTYILANFRMQGMQNCEVIIPQSTLRRVLKKHGLYFNNQGIPSDWFATYLNKRNTRDPISNAILRYINSSISKDAKILMTGCGSCGILFWLAQQGFSNVNGIDYVENVVKAANELANAINIKANIWLDDALNPTSKLDKYDVILALNWIFSAWGGDYGNKPCDPKKSLELLKEFISNYITHLSKGGFLIIQLIDSIADFKIPPLNIFPVRHSSEQVSQCANELGLSIEKKMFCGKYGHQPSMTYIMRKK